VYGQLGNQVTTKTLVAVKVLGVTASGPGVGDLHSCVISAATATSGAVQCFGSNSYGQLGNNSTNDSLQLVTASTSSSASSVALGTSHSCAVLNNSNASIECWGHNDYGQLGNATESNSPVPVGVKALTQVKSLAAGDDFTCAVIAGGAVYCWGDNWFGSLGDGTGSHGSYSTVPARVVGF